MNCELKIKLGHIELQNPVIPASGTCGFGQEMSEWFDLNILGAIATKGTTREPRYGNALPRIAECPAGLINAIGLQNPGVDEVIAHELPALRQLYRGPIIANISGFSIDEYAHVCERIDKETDAAILELNISCPNVHNGGMAFGTSPEAAAEVTKAVKAVTTKPVFVKLSPNVTDIASIARVCVDAGADGLCLINTMLGMRIMVNQVYKACPGTPIIGCGGVGSAEDVIEMMMAGASAVEIGAANLQNPMVCREIIETLPEIMKQLKINHLQDIIGVV